MSAPVKITCPDIDKAIKLLNPLINQIIKLKEYDYESAQTMKDLLSECENAMSSAVGYFEDLRQSNDALRNWGKEMEEEAETLQVQVNELQEQLTNINN